MYLMLLLRKLNRGVFKVADNVPQIHAGIASGKFLSTNTIIFYYKPVRELWQDLRVFCCYGSGVKIK